MAKYNHLLVVLSKAKDFHTGLRIRIRGTVQGVGFRPFVWRLAHQYQLAGHVLNDGEGLLIDVWGNKSLLDGFSEALLKDCPPLARIDSLQHQFLSDQSTKGFQIIPSQSGVVQTGIVADAATCSACIADIHNPENRRYRYPFTNCTNCGPRLSIIDAIPYDRVNTSMAQFAQCSACHTEYNDPENRRFHAQPNACPACGPRVWLEPDTDKLTGIDVLEHAQALIKQGHIIAIKGLGGFHLACDARNQLAVSRLRERKQRDAKPFALMARHVSIIKQYCKFNETELNLLDSPQSPVVLLESKASIKETLAPSIAPGQKRLGFMLPYTPLHHILLQTIDFPLVMTSANRSNNPQCIDNDSARSDLKGIADYWLMHDRDILHRMDDSVVQQLENKTQILRRARGYAPTSIPLPKGFENAQDILALGGELKNTFCLIKAGQAIMSQHMGDLENIFTLEDYEKNLALYQRLFNHQPEVLAIDAHPEYLSSKLGREKAETEQLPLVEVPHHHAHIAACLADNGWSVDGGKVLGIVLDGLGYGQDGNLWGGEFLLADYQSCQRLGSFKPVALIGAGKAMQEPWRNTYAHLLAAFGWEKLWADYTELELLDFFKQKPYATLNAMLEKNINSPLASSCGRLFDAVAAAIGICREKNSYEGQAAIELEAMVTPGNLAAEKDNAYDFYIDTTPQAVLSCLDPTTIWTSLLADLQAKCKAEVIAARFHLGLAKSIVEMVKHLAMQDVTNPIQHIVLSGGVFQNRILFQLVTQQLRDTNYTVLYHQQVPANDGGLALGQAVVALAQTIKEKPLCA